MTVPNSPTPEPKGEWTDGGKTWIGEPELEPCPIVSRVQIVKQIKAAESNSHADIAKHLQEYIGKLLAAAIAKLTAERDATRTDIQRVTDALAKETLRAEAAEQRVKEWEARLLSCDANLTHTLKEYTEMTLERDRAEKRVKELVASNSLIDSYAAQAEDTVRQHKLVSQVLAVKDEALDIANTALEDWLHKYAPDECNEALVQATSKRISEAGGTPAYLADVFAAIRRARYLSEGK